LFDKIKKLCNEHGISIARLEKELGFGNATIQGWRKSSPTVEKLKSVADYFGVTVDELLKD
jgi:transcriptional regulator with XRE-family HTH domain